MFAAAAALFAASTCPGVFWGDSAEFARRAATLELSPIARGYPLHRLLTWLAGSIAGNPAAGSNAVSALFGAVAVALAYEYTRRISGSRLGAVAGAAALGLGTTFWKFSGEAEVYTLHASILLALLLAVDRAAESAGARRALGLLVGLSFLHHRMTAFAFPGLLVALVVAFRAATGDRGTGRRIAQVAVGLAAGLVPFVVLCLFASRTPPADAPSAFLWWVRDVFLGGDRNADHLFGSGTKSPLANALYLAKWIALEFPGPALLLCAAGGAIVFRRGGQRAWLFALLLPVHLIFPFRYDWTGDQYSFLIPFHTVAAPLAGVAVAALVRSGYVRTARIATAGVIACPLAVAFLLGATPAGERLMPGLSAESRRLLFLPLRTGYDVPHRVCSERLSRMPPAALIHSDWGDGQVYRYLQDVERLRPDVEIRIWYGAGPRLHRDGRAEFVSVMPSTRVLPAPVAALGDALEPAGDGFWSVRPGGPPK